MAHRSAAAIALLAVALCSQLSHVAAKKFRGLKWDPSGPHEHIERDLDFIILKVDLKNALNKVSRFHVLRLVVKHFPGLARWVHW